MGTRERESEPDKRPEDKERGQKRTGPRELAWERPRQSRDRTSLKRLYIEKGNDSVEQEKTPNSVVVRRGKDGRGHMGKRTGACT